MTSYTSRAHGANPPCGDVRDPASGLPRVLGFKCGTCIFRPGNLMHLPPGYRDQLVDGALARDSWIVCHATLPDTGHPHGTQAICRGFWDLHARDSLGCRLATAFGGPIHTPPPNEAADDTDNDVADHGNGNAHV